MGPGVRSLTAYLVLCICAVGWRTTTGSNEFVPAFAERTIFGLQRLREVVDDRLRKRGQLSDVKGAEIAERMSSLSTD